MTREGAPLDATARFEPAPGTVVAGKYRVERVLGEGGMGVVVAATHLGLDQRVAIKFLRASALRNQQAVERFQREAKVAARVKSEHIAAAHDVGTLPSGEPFIVMDYLEGTDLRDLLDASKKGALEIADACEIALQACEALAQIHGAGIVHRDLKPSNLFVTRRPDGSPCVKLLDFGISKLASEDESADPALTATEAIMGSPSYMSPEQVRSTKEVDARTDVWSLGVVLYEALAGRPPFRADTPLLVCAQIAADSAPRLSSLRHDVPPSVDDAIMRCLEKEPETRAGLVDLARAVAEFAPERARPSLTRIEAIVGPSARSGMARRRTTRIGWRVPLALAAVVVLGLVATSVGSRRLDVDRLRVGVRTAGDALASAVATTPSAHPVAATAGPPPAPAPAAIPSAAAPLAAPVPTASALVPVATTAEPAVEGVSGPGVADAAEGPEALDAMSAPPVAEALDAGEAPDAAALPSSKSSAAVATQVAAPPFRPAHSASSSPPTHHGGKPKHTPSKILRKHP